MLAWFCANENNDKKTQEDTHMPLQILETHVQLLDPAALVLIVRRVVLERVPVVGFAALALARRLAALIARQVPLQHRFHHLLWAVGKPTNKQTSKSTTLCELWITWEFWGVESITACERTCWLFAYTTRNG